MASFNPFPSDNTKKDNMPLEEETLEIKNRIEKNIDKIEPPSKKEVVFTSTKSYYIIAGAFAERKNAVKMRDKLLNWNYNPKILDDSKLIRVSYNTFDNREDALLALNTIRRDNADAWLLTK